MRDRNDNQRSQPASARVARRRRAVLTICSVLLVGLGVTYFDVPTLLTVVRGAERTLPRYRAVKDRKSSLVQRLLGHVAGTDCNGNGIPDEDDIEDCGNDPACDDCNLNELPDACDITAGTSVDLNLNGVPDECIFFDDGGVDENWNTPENWDDDEVPNNLDKIDDESVTIDLNDADLDTQVEVDTLRLLGGSVLSVLGQSSEDFEIEEMGGMQIASDLAQQSKMLVGNERTISVPIGTLNIRSGGVYQASAMAQQPVAARLEAGNVLIESRCGEPIPGEMTLSGQMDTEIFGDLVIDARQDCVVCAFCTAGGRAAATIAGGETPPILRVKDTAVLRVAGSFAILGAGQFIHQSSVPIEIGGNFINQSPCPECFQGTGTLVLGPIAGPRLPQTFEVAGADVGPVPTGFNQNFAINVLEITPHAVVDFVDAFPNTTTGLTEALYVRTLILDGNATISLDNCRIYYNSFIDKGGTVTAIGTGALVYAPAVDFNAFSTLAGCLNGPNQPPALLNCNAADLDNDGDIDLHDFTLLGTGLPGR